MFKIDIICITETWVKSKKQELFTFQGYIPLLSCRINRNGGGCAILIQKDLDCEIISELKYSDEDNNMISAELLICKKQLAICTIYRKPDNKLEKVNDFLITLDNHLVETGDFNINILDTKKEKTKLYKERMLANSLYLCDKRPIRHSD